MSKKALYYLTYGLTFLLSLCSLLYELLIAQTLSVLAVNMVVWYSLTIGLYLIAMGIGVFYCQARLRPQQPNATLLRVELGLTFAGGLSVVCIFMAHMFFSYLWVTLTDVGAAPGFVGHLLPNSIFYLIVFTVIMGIGFLSGLELPLLIQMARAYSESEPITHKILSADYFGALSAGVIFPLWLVPNFSLLSICFLVAMMNALCAGCLVLYGGEKRQRSLWGSLGRLLVGIIILSVALAYRQPLQQYFLKKYYFYYEATNLTKLFRGMKGYPAVERFRSAYSTIDIVERTAYENALTPTLIKAYAHRGAFSKRYPKRRFLFINREFQMSTDTEPFYHEYFAHVPIFVSGTIPQRVLVLGAGDGLLIREILKYPQVRQITHVEIDQEMVRLAKEHPVLRYVNQRSLEDARVETRIRDAFHYVKDCSVRYDAIYIDFPAPTEYNVSKLYSAEFYRFAGQCLAKDGFIVVDAPWMTGYPLGPRLMQKWGPSAFGRYFSTLREAGYHGIMPYFINLEIDNKKIQQRVAERVAQLISEGENQRFIEAYQFMEKQMGKKAVIKKILESHSQELQQGFIMVSNRKKNWQGVFNPSGVALRVLNEERFHRAFLVPETLKAEYDASKVNSILRPTLPDMRFVNGIKLPY